MRLHQGSDYEDKQDLTSHKRPRPAHSTRHGSKQLSGVRRID